MNVHRLNCGRSHILVTIKRKVLKVNKIYPWNYDNGELGAGSLPEVANRDNHDLGPCRLPEVTGDAAREIPEFVPTHDELATLAKHWIKQVIDDDYFFFRTSCGDCCSLRERMFAERRIRRIAWYIGEEAAKRAIDDAYHEYGEKVGHSRGWQVYLKGTAEERRAFQMEPCEMVPERQTPSVQEVMSLYDHFLCFLDDEPHDLRHRRVDMDWMEELRRWVQEDPSLMQPEKKRELVGWLIGGRADGKKYVTESGEFIMNDHQPPTDNDSTAA
jgi:hypothetical protein